jgi:phosphonate transport system permease protein
MKTAAEALAEFERERNTLSVARLKLVGVVGLIIAFYVALSLVHFDLGRLAKGLPRIGHWLATAWPPKFSEMPIFLWRTAETIAMAAIGTTLAVIFALPLALFASRNLTPLPQLYHPIRWFLNALRGIASFVFALLFVAAVGLGPFAGVLGIALHTTGTAAKFFLPTRSKARTLVPTKPSARRELGD